MQWNLQLFAEKTEQPTARRKTEAKRKGQVARSPDLTAAVGFLALVGSLWLFGGGLLSALWQAMILLLGQGTLQAAHVTLDRGDVQFAFIHVFSALIPIVLTGLGVGLLTAFAQVGPMFVPSLLVPDFTRIDFLKGVARFFSVRSIEELIKSMIKLGIIAIAVYLAIMASAPQVLMLVGADPAQLFALFINSALMIFLYVAVAFLVLSFADFLFQRFQFNRNIKMTKQEVKDEMKQAEGNPAIKRKIRERGRAIARRRMLHKVPTADVIITNPTHYAVALRYDAKTMHAPQVIAKGSDQLAHKIREIAIQHDVPIVENRPLARSLYQLTEIDEFVPPELFAAVAEVLAYVYRLQKRNV
ncbi:flagellar biosynthesis protein FlhB [Sulfoacidibacillus thermotolerans]|uniref:Flagellar biosynthetic protein FlhB n=1 Tax=Sulfoacidibacillus thermotolerans TaxID=1765684 RepID=A0A2U3DAB6_SULT2|nr:flagellar biosynthesis protein FlhB [Sulfoacidibacillus thermotolerans]PWI58202.1 flagellar biosynthesis protein FlhB [Sulfoacidibacillus thermotolerans]